MNILLQNLSNGVSEILNVPMPIPSSHEIVIQSTYSAVSLGTERMLVDFSKANYFQKAKQQPEKVKQVLEKVKTDGLMTTYNAVKSKLNQPIPLGYSNIGKVIARGKSVTQFSIGDTVISNGSHAEVVCVSQNLACKVPKGVPHNEASFTVIASIALQGVRLMEPKMGDIVAVQGLGLIGLITVQLLKANGCQVIGLDFDESKLELATEYGAETINLKTCENPDATILEMTNGYGVDGSIITASNPSHEIIHQAASFCRQRGKIILIGVIGLNLDRNDFYKKELSFQVSCSYGPGRYDETYESKGQDYPYSYVRWTAQRNFSAVLQLLSEGKLNFSKLISTSVDFEKLPAIYNELDTSALGILIKYPNHIDTSQHVKITPSHKQIKTIDVPRIGILGAGNFGSQIILPALKKLKCELVSIATRKGTSALLAAKNFGIENATTDIDTILKDPSINTIVILTPHHTHADQIINALNHGKHVFVEKPLAITLDSLNEISAAYEKNSHLHLLAGFNRRFSPLAIKAKSLLSPLQSPLFIQASINAGYIPQDHWTQDPNTGGGRLIGEGCHFVDLCTFLADSDIIDWNVTQLNGASNQFNDSFSLQLLFKNGSVATINYYTNGNKSFPKEQYHISCGEKMLLLDNFRELRGWGFKSFKKHRLHSQDKGYINELSSFLSVITGKKEKLISWESLFKTTEVTINASKKL